MGASPLPLEVSLLVPVRLVPDEELIHRLDDEKLHVVKRKTRIGAWDLVAEDGAVFLTPVHTTPPVTKSVSGDTKVVWVTDRSTATKFIHSMKAVKKDG